MRHYHIMATFKYHDGRVADCTAKQFVRSIYKDAESGTHIEGQPKEMVCRVYSSWNTLQGNAGVLLGEGRTVQKAWLDAAIKIQSRLQAGGYK